tara:strand:- start:2134 stop:2832 length:699 start_codon:yes stop_codon:yes gene_type:complete
MDKIQNLIDYQLTEINLSYQEIVISLVLSVVCSAIIKYFYVKHSKSLSNKVVFSDIFILLSVVTCIVITIVKFSLALSLGLVGALSIVRFRAAIKEPEELVYLFLVIAIGLGAGAGQFKATITLTLFAIFIIYFQNYLKKTNKTIIDTNVLKIECEKSFFKAIQDEVGKISNNYNISLILKSYNSSDKNCSLTYLLNFESELSLKDQSQIIEKFNKIQNSKISLIKNVPLII